MPWILRIDSGPSKGKRVPLQAGATLRVGRTARADLALPEDTFLSGVHFEVMEEGESCTLRDLNSSNGTVFQQGRVSAVRLGAGSTFTAGRTQFTVVNEVPEEPKVAVPAVEALLPESRARLLLELRTNQQPLYAVLDASRDPRVLATLLQHKTQYAWLFEPGTPPELMSFAPYLLPLPADSPALEALIDSGWTEHWGIYLTSRSSPWELLAFLKRLLLVQQPDGQEALLRFYDPRVLRPLLGSATAWQQPFLFGTVDRYLIPGEEPQTATTFVQGRNGVEQSEILLAEDGRTELVVPVSGSEQGPPPATRDRLVLLSRQMAKLEARECDSFTESLVSEMQALFPERFAIPEQGAEWVRHGVAQPSRYGIQAEADVRTYVSLVMQLGRDFDVDPQLPWASHLLHLRLAPGEKLSRLVKAAAEQQKQLAPK